jgi:hypothetical protein
VTIGSLGLFGFTLLYPSDDIRKMPSDNARAESYAWWKSVMSTQAPELSAGYIHNVHDLFAAKKPTI